ncbi:MAG: hemerythrin domain-containing protein [Acidimicrobiales bacterium]
MGSNGNQAEQDVIDMLLQDHQEVKSLFAKFDTVAAGGRGEVFSQVSRELALHETAEEEVIYPLFRKDVSGAGAIADQRIGEEKKAEELMAEMEAMSPESPGFLQKFRELERGVLAHAEQEEREVFPKLRVQESPETLVQLAAVLSAAKKMAPTHPHPDAPSTPPGNMLSGPFLAMADRARDAVNSARQKVGS